jgi:hypothetical protein
VRVPTVALTSVAPSDVDIRVRRADARQAGSADDRVEEAVEGAQLAEPLSTINLADVSLPEVLKGILRQ